MRFRITRTHHPKGVFYMFQPLRLLTKKLLTRTLHLGKFVNFSMLLKVMHIFSMCLFWRLVKARDFEIKYMQEPGSNIRKKLFIEFQKVFWSETITKAEKNLLKALYICICERLFSIKEKSCVELRFFWERTWIRRLEGTYTSFYCSPNVFVVFAMRLFQF